MRSEEWMPTLDRIAKSMGYEAAARTEAIVIALLSAGVDREDIEMVEFSSAIRITVLAYSDQKHGQHRRYGSVDDLVEARHAKLMEEHPQELRE